MTTITGLPLINRLCSPGRACLLAVSAILTISCGITYTFGQTQRIGLTASLSHVAMTTAGYLPDPGGELTIREVLAPEMNATFQPFSPENPGYVDSIKNYWIRFTVSNNDSIDREWLFNFDGWSYVRFYIVDAADTFSVQQTGHLMPFRERDYPVGNKNYILALLKRNTTYTSYVQLQSRPDHVIAPKGLSFHASLRSVQDKKDAKHLQIISIFIGIYAIMFLYNLFVYFSTRDRAYVFYLLFILGLTYTTINNAGYSVAIFGSLFDGFPTWRGGIEAIISSLNSALLILFTMTFLNTRENLPVWHKVLRFTVIVIVPVLLIGSNVKFELFAPFIYLVMLFILITFVIVGVKSVMKKVPSAPYYLLAYIFSIAGTAILAMSLLGILPMTDFIFNYSLPTGNSLQILFFSFALANRINILKKSNDAHQKRIIEQLKENEQLQLRVTHELEEKVAKRTQEVVKQKELIEAEKEKSEGLLYNILPQTVAKELIETGTTKPARYEEVSILFTDFVDFTNISGSIPPAKLVQELNDIFHLFDDITREFGLEKIKTIGDSYMAVSGLPIEREDHAVQCVRAAIAMVKCIEKRNIESAIKWHLRAGIHSGPVVAGVVGKQKFTFDLWGDTVNMASRMESNGLPGSVNMSAYTYDLVRHKISCAYRGKISVKGKGDIDMYYAEAE